MQTPDKNSWIEGMDHADKDDLILVCVPCATEDGLDDYQHAIAWWNPDDNRWDGEWRYVDMPGAGDLEPTHWKPLDLPITYEAKEKAA